MKSPKSMQSCTSGVGEVGVLSSLQPMGGSDNATITTANVMRM
jgi:hypothetical protein